MGDIHLEQLSQPQGLGLAFDQRHRVDRKALLERSESIKLLKEHRRIKAALHTDHQSQTVVAVSQVGHVANSHKLFGVDGVLDFLDDAFRTDEVGQFSDHKPCFPRTYAFDTDGGAGFEASLAGLIRFANSIQADDGSPGG